MKVLNLYAGIGGNRKLWDGPIQVTAVEYDEDIAAVYKKAYPDDIVIVGDAHEFLLKNHNDYDFVWSSPPCQSHSRTNYFLNAKGIVRYPDMKLYQEIILLEKFHAGLFCIENVKGYYAPLILPKIINRHYFWTNFNINGFKSDAVSIGKMCGPGQTHRRKTIEQLTIERYGISLLESPIKNKQQVIRNMVDPELGLHIFNCAKGIKAQGKVCQIEIFNQL